MNKQSIPVEALMAVGVIWGFLGAKGWAGVIGTILTVIVIHYVMWKRS